MNYANLSTGVIFARPYAPHITFVETKRGLAISVISADGNRLGYIRKNQDAEGERLYTDNVDEAFIVKGTRSPDAFMVPTDDIPNEFVKPVEWTYKRVDDALPGVTSIEVTHEGRLKLADEVPEE